MISDFGAGPRLLFAWQISRESAGAVDRHFPPRCDGMITSKLGWRNVIDGGRASGAGINRSQNSAKNKMQRERSNRRGDPK